MLPLNRGAAASAQPNPSIMNGSDRHRFIVAGDPVTPSDYIPVLLTCPSFTHQHLLRSQHKVLLQEVWGLRFVFS